MYVAMYVYLIIFAWLGLVRRPYPWSQLRTRIMMLSWVWQPQFFARQLNFLKKISVGWQTYVSYFLLPYMYFNLLLFSSYDFVMTSCYLFVTSFDLPRHIGPTPRWLWFSPCRALFWIRVCGTRAHEWSQCEFICAHHWPRSRWNRDQLWRRSNFLNKILRDSVFWVYGLYIVYSQ